VGFYDILRLAGPVMILALILGAIGLTLVTLSHLIPIVMGYERVPTYLDADPGGHATLAATALVTNAAGKPLFQRRRPTSTPGPKPRSTERIPSGGPLLIISAEISTWAGAAGRERSGGIAGRASWQETWVMGLIQGRR
jgi:hypothetical protein